MRNQKCLMPLIFFRFDVTNLSCPHLIHGQTASFLMHVRMPNCLRSGRKACWNPLDLQDLSAVSLNSRLSSASRHPCSLACYWPWKLSLRLLRNLTKRNSVPSINIPDVDARSLDFGSVSVNRAIFPLRTVFPWTSHEANRSKWTVISIDGVPPPSRKLASADQYLGRSLCHFTEGTGEEWK